MRIIMAWTFQLFRVVLLERPDGGLYVRQLECKRKGLDGRELEMGNERKWLTRKG